VPTIKKAYNVIEAVFRTRLRDFRTKNLGIISRSSEPKVDIDEPARIKARAAKRIKRVGSPGSKNFGRARHHRRQ